MSIHVLFEDNHLLIVDKPANLVTQPSLDHADSMETRAKKYLKEKYKKPGNVFLHAVHRLDKEVGGIVIFAKTSKALSRMNALLREGKLKKIYHAKVAGILKIKEQRLSASLVKKEHRAELAEDDSGKQSSLYYKVLEETPEYSTLEIELESGRYHQIRIQMSHHGHPILGDRKYGSHIRYAEGHIALKHTHVAFEHPVTQALLHIDSQF